VQQALSLRPVRRRDTLTLHPCPNNLQSRFTCRTIFQIVSATPFSTDTERLTKSFYLQNDFPNRFSNSVQHRHRTTYKVVLLVERFFKSFQQLRNAEMKFWRKKNDLQSRFTVERFFKSFQQLRSAQTQNDLQSRFTCRTIFQIVSALRIEMRDRRCI